MSEVPLYMSLKTCHEWKVNLTKTGVSESHAGQFWSVCTGSPHLQENAPP